MSKNIRLTIGRKMAGIIALSFIGLVALAGITAVQMKRYLYAQKETELAHLGETALEVVKDWYAAAQRGDVTTEEAQKRAAARLKSMRYGHGDYFWINDMHPRMVMHPTVPALDGKDLSDNKDPTGKRVFVEFVEVVKQHGSGDIRYEWPKPGSDSPQPKLSHVIGFAPWGWVIGTGVYVDDLDHQVREAVQTGLLAAGLVMTIVAALAAFGARRMSRAIIALTAAMKRLADGEIDAELPKIATADEIGDMAGTLEVFKRNAIENRRLVAEQREAELRTADERRRVEQREAAQEHAAEEKAAADRRAALHRVASEFERAVGQVVETVSTAASELEAAADTLSRTVETSQRLATVVAAASEHASTNVSTVASATEEMTGSIGKISRQVQESSTIAAQAVEQASRTDGRITELSQAASRIGDVVKLITAIAEQTNLLALNATIEAARAGEAGKGFAVVAQEVKALASQTAKATGEIGSQIAGMQAATGESVAAIKEIGDTIGRISQVAATIAAAVDEQGAATAEIARNVQQAAKGTAEVASNIGEVNRGAADTGSASAQVLASAQSLASESNRLKVEVQKFLQTVRAA